ncbi:MAG: hypothetical protein ABEK16_05790 [Candidatus Nanohalobium sp.]
MASYDPRSDDTTLSEVVVEEEDDRSQNVKIVEEAERMRDESSDISERPSEDYQRDEDRTDTTYDPAELAINVGTQEEGIPSEWGSDELDYVEDALNEELPSEQDAYDFPVFNIEGNITVTEEESVISVKYHLSENPTTTEGGIKTPLLVNTPEEVIGRTLNSEMEYARPTADNEEGDLRVEFSYWKEDVEPATDEVIEAVKALDPATTRESYSGR